MMSTYKSFVRKASSHRDALSVLALLIVGFFIIIGTSQAAVPASGIVGSWDGGAVLSVPHSSALDPGSSLWTVSAWVKTMSDGTVVWKGASTDMYELAVSNGKAVFTINAGGTTATASAVSSASVIDGQWHSVTGVRTGTKAVSIYVDGVLSGTATYSGSGAAIDTTSSLTIKSRNGANALTGSVGKIYVYNRALSASEVASIYEDGSGAVADPVPEPPVVVTSPASTGCTYPSEVLDLLNWKETLPTGASESPTEIKQTALATYTNDPYFKVNATCTGVQFRAHTSGVTTSGSGYPRSELREMANNGTTNASWGTNDGMIHTMYIDQAITAVPTTKKHVVAGQIHDAADDVIVIRLEYPKLFVDINGVDGPVLDANYTLGKRFTVKFVAGGGKIQVFYNDSASPVYTLTRNGTGNYFKAGVYTQSNCSTEAACSTSNYGEVNIYDVWHTHVPASGGEVSTYTINASAGSGGTISPSGAVSVSSGSSKSFTITPSAGYRVLKVLVDGSPISMSSAGGTYTLSNVTSNRIISSSFELIPVVTDTTAPTIPINVTASAVSTSQINLAWTPSLDNVGVASYAVYRNNTLIATPTSATYSDTGLTAATTYSYAIAARDAQGNSSAKSASVSGTTLSVVPPSTGKFTIGQSVVSNATVNVRQAPGGSLLGKQSRGVVGTILEGPVYAVLSSSGNYFWWWKVNFPSGANGWVGQDGLDSYVAPTAKFTIGQKVAANATVNVRKSAGGFLLGKQSKGALGTVLSGPVYAILSSSGNYFWWWNVDFASGADGWVGQDGLDPR